MNVANQLTMLRLALGLAVFPALAHDSALSHLFALGMFLTATVTDWVDGYVARRWGIISAFGKVADPIADKVLVLGAFLALTKHKGLDVPMWGVFLIFARELIIGGMRTLSMIQQGKLLAAETWGKWKMAIQSVCVILIIGILVLLERWPGAPVWLWRVPYPLTMLSVLATWVSAALYLRQNRKMLQSSW